MAKKSPSNGPGKPKGQRVFRLALLAAIIAPFVVFPPLRLRSGSQADKTAGDQAFSAHDFAAKLWADKLVPGVKTAVDARTLHAALDASVSDAAKRYARTVGIGGTSYYYIAGEGTVAAVQDDSITLSLAGCDKDTVVIETGLVFGNAVRDGTGLLDLNTFANSEEFNAIAAELNAIVEKDVLPGAKRLAVPGAKIRFAGVAEVTGTDSDPRPLVLVPVLMEALP